MSFSVYETTVAWAKERKLALFHDAVTASTSDTAKSEALTVREPFKLYLADEQTAGRGRGKNSWSNPQRGSSLLSTWSFAVTSAPQPISGPLVGLAIYETLQSAFAPKHLSIKAPNDVFLKDKKILGILLETVKQGSAQRLLVGLGLNVFCPPADVDTAGHLSSGLNIDVSSWQRFLDTLTQNLRDVAVATGQSALSGRARQGLLQALNHHPHLAQPYTSVSPFGDLSTGEKTRPWHQI